MAVGEKPPLSSPAELRATLERDGFVLLKACFSGPELSRLREACSRSVELARSGKWPFIRTLPKQFPPWPPDASSGIWGVQHLLHPDMPNNELFASSYFADSIVHVVKALLDCESEGDHVLVMELYNLLVRPDKDFALRWHRDDIPPTATPEEEMQRLGEPAWHAQWNLALHDDRSLIVVPGSHKRARTEAERAAEPYERDLPGLTVVEMKAGDIVFYNNNILHRGVYDSKAPRMTLHGSMGHTRGSSARARNVLQHGVGEWVDKSDFSALSGPLEQRATKMRSNLHAMAGASGKVGYFAEDE